MSVPNGAHRRAVLPIYVPAVLLGIPSQAVMVLLPLYVLELGGGVAAASAVVGLRGLGMMAMDIPAGVLAARRGDRFVMLLAITLVAVAYLGLSLTDDVAWCYPVAFLYGAASSTFLLGRMSHVTASFAPAVRGRVIAMIAGLLRFAALLGPLAGAASAETFGFSVTFAGAAGVSGLAWLCVALFAPAHPPERQSLRWSTIPALAWTHRGVFATAGVAAIVFMLMRAGRTVLLPLMGAALGLETTTIGLLVTLSALVDVAMFYPAGMIMDRHGRRATMVPSSVLFALALGALGLAHDAATLLWAALALGFANGLSTGIVMTLGTDLAPPGRRGEFLGLWRLLTDVGTAAGPLAVSAVVAVASLHAAALCLGAVGAAGSYVVWRFVGETMQR